jgi:hypothetical protein
MKKRSSCGQNPKPAVKTKRAQQSVTIGMDLGDKTSRYCLLSDEGEISSGRSGGDYQSWDDGDVRAYGAGPDRDRSRDPFSMGEPPAGESWA